jgi:hypothetical protein
MVLRIAFVHCYLAAALATQSQVAEKPVAVIQRAVKAHGGEANLKKFKAGHTKADGIIALGAGVPFTQEAFYELPSRMKEIQVLEANGQKRVVTIVLDGDHGWLSANGQTVPLSETVLGELREAIHLIQVNRLVSLLEDKRFRLSPLQDAQVEGAAAYGLRVSTTGRRDTDLYFSKETGLLIKVERRMRDLGTMKEFTEARVYSEFLDANGIRIPRKTVVFRDGKEFMRAQVAEVAFLESLDQRVFSKP